MATITKRFDVVVSETYKNKNGEEKTYNHKIGEGIMFDSGVIKIRRYDGNVTYTMFEQKQKEEVESKKEEFSFD